MIEQFNVLPIPACALSFLALGASFMLLEYLLTDLAHREVETHDLAETAASFGVALGQNLVRALEAGHRRDAVPVRLSTTASSTSARSRCRR